MNEKEIYLYLKNKYGKGEKDLFHEDSDMMMHKKNKSMHREYGMHEEGHEGFEKEEAKELVEEMYHTESGKVYKGEFFTLEDAKEVKKRYRGIIPPSVEECDIYVAINAQYHDYINLFKTWFTSNISHKIVESALIFWFQDEDYEGAMKLKEYFCK